jgi:hypothetical protein
MYSLVFVTERYVAPFLVLFWAGFMSYWRFQRGEPALRVSMVASLIMILAIMADVLALNLDGFVSVAGIERPSEGSPASQFSGGQSDSPPVVAEALRDAGVEPGTDIALIGEGYTALWVHLAGLRVVAEVPSMEAKEFWEADEATRDRVFHAFRVAGASNVVAEVHPGAMSGVQGWSPLGETEVWLFQEALR